MAIVYRHRRLDTFEVFYVGIGNKVKRAYSKGSRNRHWHNIANKCGYVVEILAENLKYEDVKELEIFLISQYGRQDLGTGILVNLTDGGDGTIGRIHPTRTQEHRDNLSKAHKGIKKPSLSGEHKLLISIRFKGKQQSEKHKNNKADSLRGKKRTLEQCLRFKEVSTSAKVVLDLYNGIFYDSIKDAAKALSINYATLKNKLGGRVRNNTNLIIV